MSRTFRASSGDDRLLWPRMKLSPVAAEATPVPKIPPVGCDTRMPRRGARWESYQSGQCQWEER